MKRLILRALVTLLAATVAVAGVLIAIAPRSLDYQPDAPVLGTDLDSWLASRESDVHDETPIIDQAEKRIRWQTEAGARTPLSVVYLHGFSATRQEIAPVGELIADALGANLFETRLAGHGLTVDALANARAEDWLDDGAEALSVGAAIGDRIVLVGTSTGATLAVALADHETFGAVANLILLSPNFAVPDPSAEALTWPGGPQLARAMIGATRSWTPANAAQEKYWSTTYPTAALVEMMRLVKRARNMLPLELSQSVLTIYSPNDGVVDTEWVQRAAGMIAGPHTDMVEIARSGDPSNHVLAGDILSAETNAVLTNHIVRFVRSTGL